MIRFTAKQNLFNLQKKKKIQVPHCYPQNLSYWIRIVSLTLTNSSLQQMADFPDCEFVMTFWILKKRLHYYIRIWILPSTHLFADHYKLLLNGLSMHHKYLLCWWTLCDATYSFWKIIQKIKYELQRKWSQLRGWKNFKQDFYSTLGGRAWKTKFSRQKHHPLRFAYKY